MQLEYSKKVEGELLGYISNPSVLMTQKEEPYEFRTTNGAISRLKNRRVTEDIPYHLYSFIIANEVTILQLREFSSGVFLNFADTSSIYN